MYDLFSNVLNITWQQCVMWVIGGLLIYLAIKKDMEPSLLLPLGFGAILVNLPMSGAVTQIYDGVKEIGVIDVLFNAGIANELFPLLLFVGIGAMIDFGPLLSNPKLMIFGAAALFLTVGGWLLWQEWVRYQYEKAHKDDPESWNDELAEEAERRRSAGEDAPAETPEDGEDAP